MAANLGEYIRGILPATLRRRGYELLDRLADLLDADLARLVALWRNVDLRTASLEALDLHAVQSSDRRTLVDTIDTFRAYLRRRRELHGQAGSLDLLRFQIRRCGYVNFELWDELAMRTAGYLGPAGEKPFGENWGFFFVIIRPPHKIDASAIAVWGSSAVWGGGSNYVWGGLQSDYVSEVALTLLRWRATGFSPRFIVIDFDNTTTIDGTTPDGFAGNHVVVPIYEPANPKVGDADVDYYNHSWWRVIP